MEGGNVLKPFNLGLLVACLGNMDLTSVCLLSKEGYSFPLLLLSFLPAAFTVRFHDVFSPVTMEFFPPSAWNGQEWSGVEFPSPIWGKFSALPAGEMCFLPNSRPLLREGSGVFHQRYIIILWSHSRGIFLGSFPYESLRAFYRGVSPHRSPFLTLTLVLTQPPATHRSHVRCSCSFAAPGSFCSRLSGAVSDVPFFSDFGKLFVL